jgi:hypothetical protein
MILQAVCRAQRSLEAARTAPGFPFGPGPSCRRPDVLAGGAAPTPPQVEHDRPGEQKADWDKKDQHEAHHYLLPEIFSAYAPQAGLPE